MIPPNTEYNNNVALPRFLILTEVYSKVIFSGKLPNVYNTSIYKYIYLLGIL